MADWTKYIKEVGRGAHGARALAEAEAQALFGAMLEGAIPELELGALWMAYRIKGESCAELLAFCRAADAACLRLAAPQAGLPVVLPSYNGARRVPNMTPLLALLLARAGVPVLVHGLTAGYGRVTSAALFEALGVPACADAQAVQGQMAAGVPAWMPLETLNPGLARLMGMRARIGVRSSAHTVTKLLDPFAGRALRVVPVTHPEYLVRMGEVLAAQGSAAVLMRGSEGEPYASPKRMPALTGFGAGAATELVAQGEHEEETPGMPADIGVDATVAWTRAVLAGQAAVPRPLSRQLACLLAAARAPG